MLCPLTSLSRTDNSPGVGQRFASMIVDVLHMTGPHVISVGQVSFPENVQSLLKVTSRSHPPKKIMSILVGPFLQHPENVAKILRILLQRVVLAFECDNRWSIRISRPITVCMLVGTGIACRPLSVALRRIRNSSIVKMMCKE